MEYIYPFFISFMLIFFSELGDKTQILVLSFSTKHTTKNILLGVTFGTFFSHGLAILFGSKINSLNNDYVIYILKICTFIIFLIFGIMGFFPFKKNTTTSTNKDSVLNIFAKLTKNCIFIIASSIVIGELGDKTFLASIGLGFQYFQYKIPLILGAICGMLSSDSIAIIFGKLIETKLSQKNINLISNLFFILFGIIGLINLII